MKTIIVATDFSAPALNAAKFAANMSDALGAGLLLFNTFNIPVSYSGEIPVTALSAEELKKASISELEKLKGLLLHSVSRKLYIETQSKLGDTVDELESLCRLVKPFTVVMGATGKSGIENIIFGSTTLTAIRHVTSPILCVPNHHEYGKGIQKIAFACDFREVAQTTPAVFIKSLIQQFNAELHILNVDYKDRNFKASARQESFFLHEMFKEVNPQYHFINDDDVEYGIHVFAEENQLDLIITVPKKHKLLDSFFKPSKTKQLVQKSAIPVLCIHE